MQERVEALEAQLAEREQLVAALTERLEQAAEQLDRLHRTGADRGVRAGIAGVPPELISQQQKLVADLQRAVEQWEAMQPGAFFGKLESQLGQIHEMVQQIDRTGSAAETDSAFRYGDSQSDRGNSEHGEQRRSEAPRSILDFMKASQQPDPNAHEAEKSVEPAATPASTGVFDIELPPLEDPPTSADLAGATNEELQEACGARDAYIAYLLNRLQKIESLGHVPNSWAGLENVPDELRTRLEALEHRLQETARIAEVELSLQRAKLSREELRIRVTDEQLQKDIKRAKTAADSQSSDEPSDRKGDQSGSRWKRMMGR
jgi:hypothetical protein